VTRQTGRRVPPRADVEDGAVHRVGHDPPPGRVLREFARHPGRNRPVPFELAGRVGQPEQGGRRHGHVDLHPDAVAVLVVVGAEQQRRRDVGPDLAQRPRVVLAHRPPRQPGQYR
jgi:hypothetical protein